MALKLKYDFTKPIWDDADDQIDAQKGPSLDVVRASTANVTDYFNVIKTVKANEPRFTGGRRVENLVTRSQDITTGWTELFASSTADATTDPDGGSTADKLLETTDTNVHRSTAPSITPKVAAQYTSSIYVKGGLGRDFFALQTDFGGVNTTRFFNISTGVTGTNSGAAQDAYGIEDAGNGWYRCWTTITAISTTASSIRANIASADGTSSYAGDITRGLYFWGAQVENVSGQDDPSPSEYIATTTAAVSKWYATKRRTNLCLHSEDFTNAAWVENTGATKTTGQSDPVGGTDAVKVVTTSSLNSGVYQQNIGSTTNESKTYSCWIKGESGGEDIDFGDATNRTELILTTEWQRLSATATNASDYFVIYSDSAVQTFYVYGAQIEKGSTATDYIATTTTVASSSFDTAITPTGLLVEEARTNICLQSEDFSTGWTTGFVTVGTDAATAPNGTTTSDKLTPTTDADTHRIYTNVGGTSATLTHSAFVKADGYTQVGLRESASTGASAVFELSDGTVDGTHDAGDLTVTATSITDVGNGWYRISMTMTDAGTTTQKIGIHVLDGSWTTGDVISTTYAGDGTSSIFAWGAQVEAGAFPTSYIPTVAASVTRSADVVSTTSFTGAGASGHTLYVNGSVNRPMDTTRYWASLLLASPLDMMRLAINATPDVQAQVFTAGANQGTITPVGAPAIDGTAVRIVHAVAENDAIVYADGNASPQDTTVTLPDGMDSLRVGYYAASNAICGHISEIRYYNERLDNTALENMSNGIFPTTGGKSGPSLAFGGMGKMGLRS